MFEYKVVQSKLSLSNNIKNFEDLLNSHAREGWRVISCNNESMQFHAVLERSKNR